MRKSSQSPKAKAWTRGVWSSPSAGPLADLVARRRGRAGMTGPTSRGAAGLGRLHRLTMLSRARRLVGPHGIVEEAGSWLEPRRAPPPGDPVAVVQDVEREALVEVVVVVVAHDPQAIPQAPESRPRPVAAHVGGALRQVVALLPPRRRRCGTRATASPPPSGGSNGSLGDGEEGRALTTARGSPPPGRTRPRRSGQCSAAQWPGPSSPNQNMWPAGTSAFRAVVEGGPRPRRRGSPFLRRRRLARPPLAHRQEVDDLGPADPPHGLRHRVVPLFVLCRVGHARRRSPTPAPSRGTRPRGEGAWTPAWPSPRRPRR